MQLEAKFVLLRYPLGGRDRASLEMHLEAKIKFNSEMHLEAVIERVWRCTWRPRSSQTQRYTRRPWSIKIGGVLGGRRSGGGRSEGKCDGSWHSIHWLTCNRRNVQSWVQHGPPRDWLGAGDSRSWDDAVPGVCSTRCMLYSVYAILGVNSWSLHGEIDRDDLTLCS